MNETFWSILTPTGWIFVALYFIIWFWGKGIARLIVKMRTTGNPEARSKFLKRLKL